jgi:putative (di)nucleoside polyphosphate hydrolase
MNEFFRASVGMIIRDRSSGRVMVFERVHVRGAWQYPQGGIEAGERPLDAAWRELRQEAGLSRSAVRFVVEHDRWTTYVLPVELRSPKSGLGQTQRWHLFELLADPAVVIALDRDVSQEFRAWRWTTPRAAALEVAAFRRPVYEELADWLEAGVSRG